MGRGCEGWRQQQQHHQPWPCPFHLRVRSQHSNFKAKREATLEHDTGETFSMKNVRIKHKKGFFYSLLLLSLPQCIFKDVWHSEEIQLILLIDLSYLRDIFWRRYVEIRRQFDGNKWETTDAERVISDIYEIIGVIILRCRQKGMFFFSFLFSKQLKIIMLIAYARFVCW